LSQFKKYHPPANLKFYNLGIFQSLKLRILVEKILLFSHKLNFTPNTLGCYGLSIINFIPNTLGFYVLNNVLISISTHVLEIGVIEYKNDSNECI